MILKPEKIDPSDPVGGKAASLASLDQAGFQIPEWFVIPPGVNDLPPLKGLFAVRSSAMAEDGSQNSFAGQFESFLNVEPPEVADKIEAVRQSARSDRLSSYQNSRGEIGEHEMAVIVQKMIPAKTAGVAFGADPVTGRRNVCLVSGVSGLGEALVSGESNSENWIAFRDGKVEKSNDRDGPKILSKSEVREISELCQKCSAHFGYPQDIEWARDRDDKLWLLQSRPITTLTNLPDPDDDLTIWDNSNIAESYGGVTTPLTFTFAKRIYGHVYREFCKLLGVPAWKVEVNEDVFPRMLGLIQGRVYYNLVSWYRVLALLPGFSVNRGFMEQMMGVKKPLPDEVVEKIISSNTSSKFRDFIALAKTSFGLFRQYLGLEKQINHFQERLDAALKLGQPLQSLRFDELLSHYHNLEEQLLKKWDAPLVNDFFAMIFYGILNKRVENANDFLRDTGEIVSAKPPRLIIEMAEIVREDPKLADLLVDHSVSVQQKKSAVRNLPALSEKFEAYLEEFGDRCLEELKLESPTVEDDPGPLLQSIGSFSFRKPKPQTKLATPRLPGFIDRWLLKRTRRLIRNRENLRFERTRVFGRVRKVMRELSSRLVTDGSLKCRDDIFYLELGEILDTERTLDFRHLVEIRKAEFGRYREAAPPPDRIRTRGPLHRYKTFPDDGEEIEQEGDLSGIGACPGIVSGPVRVVDDPRNAVLKPGEILVAQQTDPGWVVLFPAASGLLVERGSLLSHSAIVARELQLPCIVSLAGITRKLTTGDNVEMDGQTGRVTLIES